MSILEKILDGFPDGGVWLMPFASISLALYWKLRKENIEIAGFIDNTKGGSGLTFDSLSVVQPESVDKNSSILISSLKYGERMKLQLIDRGFHAENIQFSNSLLTIEDIHFAKDEAKRCDIESKYPVKHMDEAFDLYEKSHSVNDLLRVNDAIEVVVTQRCNLKCKECANMMQYYTNPEHIDLNITLKSIDRLFEFVNFVGKLDVLGGEPFLLKELHVVLDKLSQYRDKCGDVVVITNGTIVPSEDVLDAIKRADARVIISDYGPISKRKNDLAEALERKNIKCNIYFTGGNWKKQNYFTDGTVWHSEKANAIFYECRSACKEIMNGKLAWCVYISHGEALNAFPKDAVSSLDLLDERLEKSEVVNYFNRKEAFPACRYCKGMIGEPESIPVAEQISAPVPYRIWGG